MSSLAARDPRLHRWRARYERLDRTITGVLARSGIVALRLGLGLLGGCFLRAAHSDRVRRRLRDLDRVEHGPSRTREQRGARGGQEATARYEARTSIVPTMPGW